MTETPTVDKIEENKEQIIESVSEETGLNNSPDRLLVRNAVDNLILDQEFEDEDLSEYQYSETTIIEDIMNFMKGGKVINSGKIVDISKSERYKNKLVITVKVSETEDTFTKSFHYNDSMSENLKSLFALVGVKSGNPSDLLNKKVPIDITYQDGNNYDYEIHWPPKSGLLSKIYYKINRISRKCKFISLTENKSNNFNYKPTLRLYTLMTIVFIGSISFPIPVLGFLGFCISATSIFLLLSYHIVVLMETYDIA